MEDVKKSSATSSPSDLFGSKDHSILDSSSEIFKQIFSTPSKESLPTIQTEKKLDSGSKNWSSKKRVSDKSKIREEWQSQKAEIKASYNSNTNEKVVPFHYSSSIYYGGQDDYSGPEKIVPNTVFTTFNKDGGEDDSDGATRGNWWKGSLYY